MHVVRPNEVIDLAALNLTMMYITWRIMTSFPKFGANYFLVPIILKIIA